MSHFFPPGELFRPRSCCCLRQQKSPSVSGSLLGGWGTSPWDSEYFWRRAARRTIMKMLFFLADIFTKSKSVSFMRKYYQKNATSLLAKITFCKTFTNTFLSLALILALFISRTISRRRLSVENIYFKVYAFTITLYIYTLHSIFRYQTKKTDLDECRGGHTCYFSQPDIRAFLTCCYFLDPPPFFDPMIL